MINPYILLALVVGWGASVAGAGWYGLEAGDDRATARQARDEQIRKQTFDAAQEGAAAAIAKNKPINTTIVQKTQKEIRENTIYADCRVPASGLQLANQAITGRPAEPAGGEQLPAPDAPKR
jgi:hypothetical protein